jgi:GNAT superfamily N-acetyltransferase
MESAYDPPVNVRRMRPDELDSAVSVWREANIARGAAHGPERTARIREKLSASEALPFVALRPGIVGMALAEPGRFDDGVGEPDPSLLHISMVFVHPTAQRTGVGLPLVLHDRPGEHARAQALRACRDGPHRQERLSSVRNATPIWMPLERMSRRWPCGRHAGTGGMDHGRVSKRSIQPARTALA